ncbi:unnamed protein product [Staurois parvus]|uniref:Uncharacterized protein n=1 Tax=Staurois parvus TaxID=386267 RepID=A0ABN9C6E5_9NEOB|nr:unnamed protein product [Staurois parvus]
MGPPTDTGPSGSARVSKWSVRPWVLHMYLVMKGLAPTPPHSTALTVSKSSSPSSSCQHFLKTWLCSIP